jgi:DNA-binding NarL/FixJ family response regulator
MCGTAVPAIVWRAKPIRCLIVDDNSAFRLQMGGLLEEHGLEVVGGAASAAEALQQIAELRPDVALIDIDLGRDSGLTLATRLMETPRPAVSHVILISTHDEAAFAELIERSSALGFLPKTELSGAAIRRMVASATSATNRSGERRGT